MSEYWHYFANGEHFFMAAALFAELTRVLGV